jgi:hypothetical protein
MNILNHNKLLINASFEIFKSGIKKQKINLLDKQSFNISLIKNSK